ncbi:MAG: aldehyde ferredoxin oxidoreductase N-terminal domain-containing protein, partial [Methanosarcinaceae archaeon]|nr:aldehyde ferredoxin oxidoreductase N-terminal domain-containing protein [Methanosarcinaceae archaeon]
MLGAYTGKMLEVDLGSGKLSDVPLDEEMAKTYLGGKGLGLKLVYDEFRPDMQPFDPDNLLIFATGPATGLKIPT